MNTRKSLYDVSSFYNKKAVLKASFQGMRYQVEQAQTEGGSSEASDEEKEPERVLRVTVWPEPFCFEKTSEERKTVQDFPYSEEGLDQVYDWLCQVYDQRKEEWLLARDHHYEGIV